jgi:hypothetical protein
MEETLLGAFTASGDTVEWSVNPAVLGVGEFEYYARVTDPFSTEVTDAALVRVGTHVTIIMDTPGLEPDGLGNFNASWAATYEIQLKTIVTGGLGELDMQWHYDSGLKALVAIVNSMDRIGVETPVLTFSPLGYHHAGAYQLQVTDDLETTPSAFVYLQVGSPIPAAGIAGLVSLCAAVALGGVSLLRRKR